MIAVGDMVLVSNESQLSHLPKGRQKATKSVGPYKVAKVDKFKLNYTLDIPDSKRHNTFHISNVKKYVDPHLELFPNRQRRQPRISESEVDQNLEVQKIIGHERRRDGSIQFLSLWEGFPDEDSTYRRADLFKSSPYGVNLVQMYLDGFGKLPRELLEWAIRTEWVKLKGKGVSSVDPEDSVEFERGTDSSDDDPVQANALLIKLDLYE